MGAQLFQGLIFNHPLPPSVSSTELVNYQLLLFHEKPKLLFHEKPKLPNSLNALEYKAGYTWYAFSSLYFVELNDLSIRIVTTANTQVFYLYHLFFFNFLIHLLTAVAAAAKMLQSNPTLCDPIDGSPPGSPIPGILQARTLEWAAISFSNA